jgi:VCBS repeat-containing protein
MSTTITGTKDGTVTEDGVTTATGSVTLSTGLVAGKVFSVQTQTPGQYGTFSIQSNGQWTYALNNNLSAVQSLGAGQSITDSFLIDYDLQIFTSVKVLIYGKNDAAIISGDQSQTLNAANQTNVTGNLKVDDLDTGESHFTPITRLDGTWGYFSLTADGVTRYTLQANYAGASADRVETFNITSADGTIASLKITISGSPVNNATLTGTSGNDTLISTASNETITGGAGTDTAVYDGTAGQYTLRINRAAQTATVTDSVAGRDGTDSLTGVEKVQFGNTTFDLFNPARTETPKHSKTNGFLFDASYYLLSHPELAGTVTLQTAFGHYLNNGAAAGYKPNTWFDPVFYANRWSDLRGANLDAATLFQHYNLYGVWEGRSASTVYDQYDGAHYLRDNPDVAAYVDGNLATFLGSRTNGAIAHYIIYGADEGRLAYTTSGTQVETAVIIGAVSS